MALPCRPFRAGSPLEKGQGAAGVGVDAVVVGEVVSWGVASQMATLLTSRKQW